MCGRCRSRSSTVAAVHDLPEATGTLPDGTPAVRASSAARFLGVSENTVRRRLEKGVLRGAVIPNGAKRDHLVALSALSAVGALTPSPTQPSPSQPSPSQPSPSASGGGGDEATHLLLELSMARSERDVALASAASMQVERDLLVEEVAGLRTELVRWKAALVTHADSSAAVIRALAGQTPLE
jgi:hypothetical protein